MNRSYPLVEVHYALWAVLTVPIGFAGMFFLIPGLIFEIGVPLEIIAAILIVYIAKLTRGARRAWLFGLLLHALLVLGAVYYIPRLPALLGLPLMLVNLYSLIVLLVYRKLWVDAPNPAVQPA
ncbi:MAG: hypothetical protein JSV86_19325 [Gemmatimonadota bacterium]|nr:MAG: hypothetical protein JSV86_19325 [Gemmatimonadota bacterium]